MKTETVSGNPSTLSRLHRSTRCLIAVALWNLCGASTLSARDRMVDGIMDNSFFVEEAYNQEAGVVQHIVNGVMTWNRDEGGEREHEGLLAFTQEWPAGSQKHQLSYTIPFPALETPSGTTSGVGDIALHYRFQAVFDEETLRAFAPRFSVILPTGDPDRGLGDESWGVQVNLPYSQALGDRWFVHANAGGLLLPDSGAPYAVDRQLYNVGGSGIFAMSRTFHLLVEAVGLSNETGVAAGQTDREFDALISPGARYAFNTQSGSQLVLGFAVPLGIAGSAPDYGAFLYLSFEHGFRKSP